MQIEQIDRDGYPLAPGQIGWHTSEPDGGPDVGIDIGMPDGSRLYIGELSDRCLEEWGDPELRRHNWHIVHYTLDGQQIIMGSASQHWRDRDGDTTLAAALSTRPDSDMVERVAREICIALHDQHEPWTPPADWDGKVSYLDQPGADFHSLARAAIAAMGSDMGKGGEG